MAEIKTRENMDLESTVSISKACFVFKRKLKRKKLRTDNKESSTQDHLYFGEQTDDPHFLQKRYSEYRIVWENIQHEFEILQSSEHSSVLNEVICFIREAHKKFSSSHCCSHEIPTVSLVTGINMPDHKAIFSSLQSLLQNNVTTYLSFVKSKNCTSVKNLIQTVVSQLLTGDSFLETMDRSITVSGEHIKTANFSLPTLVSWYTETNLQKSPKKKLKTSLGQKNSKPLNKDPVIVILEDVENLASHILEDFILICSQYSDQIPWIFIFGFPTSVRSIHSILSQTVIKYLSIEKFQAKPSSQFLSSIVQNTLMNCSIPFKLSWKTYRLLGEIFLYHDFSVNNFMKGLKFCLLEHYSSNFTSILCCQKKKLDKRIKHLEHKHLEKFRQLKSFMSYVESCSSEEQTKLLLNDQFFKGVLLEKLLNIHSYHEHFFLFLFCLHLLTKSLPTHPLGKQIQDVYDRCLESPVVDSEDYNKAMTLLKMYSREELIGKLNENISYLNNNNKSSEIQDVLFHLKQFLEKFQTKEELIEEEQKNNIHDSQTNRLNKTSNRTVFIEKLRRNASRKKNLNAYEIQRGQLVEYLTEVFRKYLLPPSYLPFYEVFYFENYMAVKQNLTSVPRSCIHKALSNPQSYLQCSCCNVKDISSILNTMPDVCIAYKLHLESGYYINLYDWLQAFVAIVDPDFLNDDEPSKKPKKLLQARFIQAVSELQCLGFIAPTKRKTDHVIRQTWGNY